MLLSAVLSLPTESMLLQSVLLLLAIYSSNAQLGRRSCSKEEDVRLVGGNSSKEGRVEVCFNKEWGTICDVLWDNQDATVVCRQLGFSTNGAIALPKAHFGEGTGIIHLGNIQCFGRETTLSQCPKQALEVNCTHSDDASVICMSENNTCSDGQLRLVGSNKENKGRVEICFNNRYGTVCDDGWDNVDASVVCGQLGFKKEGAISVRRAELFGTGSGIIYFDDVECSGRETRLSQCQHRGVAVSDCTHREDAGVVCKPNDVAVCNDTDIRLSNGRTPNEGRVEVCFNDHWGTICDDSWGDSNAQVVCRQLGYSSNGAFALLAAAYGQGDGLIFLDRVRCSGREENIGQCRSSAIGHHNCAHHEDVGVFCQSLNYSLCDKGSIRLADGLEGRPYEGRLEICINNHWGTVCDDEYNVEEATVVCRVLGFTAGTALPLPYAFFGQGKGMIWLNRVRCTGIEESLLNCSHNGVGNTNCRHSEDVSIICPLPLELPKECENGDIRLVGGKISNEGRVELCFNGHWGTVCDDGWHQANAAVVCSQLGFPSAYPNNSIPVLGALFGGGEGPILLDNVNCNGTEKSLLACQAPALGRHNCEHTEDAGVICPSPSANRICKNGQVRLVGGGTDRTQGRVEMCFNGRWGSVCSSGFNEREAEVTCRGLGFDTTKTRSILVLSGGFGPPTSPIFLNNLACNGSEDSFLQCPGTTLTGLPSCTRNQKAVAVICAEIPCTDRDYRLVGSSSPSSGRLEVCMDGLWGSLCADNNTDAEFLSKVCVSLGHQGTGVAEIPGEFYAPTSKQRYSISSNTQEQKFNTETSCEKEQTIGVSCLLKGETSNCQPGEVRLTGGSDPAEGRVEVCLSNQWGTVCDDSWNNRAAAVVCKQLGLPFEGAEMMYFGGSQSLPIHLDDIKCEGDEMNLLRCMRTNFGVHNCDHTEDAGVICKDITTNTDPTTKTTNINSSTSTTIDNPITVTNPINNQTIAQAKGADAVAVGVPIAVVIFALLLAITIITMLIVCTRLKVKSYQSGDAPITEVPVGIPTEDTEMGSTKALCANNANEDKL